MSETGETSADVQREAETERAELVSTLDQLRENLKPANVLDEVMANAKVTTSELADWGWSVARRNPIPATLIGLGAVMLIGASQRAWVTAALSDGPGDAHDMPASSDARSEGGSAPRPTGAAFAGNSHDLPRDARPAGPEASRLATGTDTLRNPAPRASSPRGRSPQHASGDTHMRQGRSRDGFVQTVSRVFEDQPLVLAALGVAVGAAIGAAIPSTEAESRFMGDASAQLKSRAQDIAAAEYAHIKETAGRTADELKRAAVDHGVSTDNLSGLIQDAGDRVKGAASDIASHAAETTGLKAG